MYIIETKKGLYLYESKIKKNIRHNTLTDDPAEAKYDGLTIKYSPDDEVLGLKKLTELCGKVQKHIK